MRLLPAPVALAAAVLCSLVHVSHQQNGLMCSTVDELLLASTSEHLALLAQNLELPVNDLAASLLKRGEGAPVFGIKGVVAPADGGGEANALPAPERSLTLSGSGSPAVLSNPLDLSQLTVRFALVEDSTAVQDVLEQSAPEVPIAHGDLQVGYLVIASPFALRDTRVVLPCKDLKGVVLFRSLVTALDSAYNPALGKCAAGTLENQRRCFSERGAFIREGEFAKVTVTNSSIFCEAPHVEDGGSGGGRDDSVLLLVAVGAGALLGAGAGALAFAVWRLRRKRRKAAMREADLEKGSRSSLSSESGVDVTMVTSGWDSLDSVDSSTPARSALSELRMPSLPPDVICAGTGTDEALLTELLSISGVAAGPAPAPLTFDAFAFGKASRGHPLVACGLAAFARLGLDAEFGLDRTKLARFLLAAERLHEDSSAYHCGTHAADVVQTLEAIVCRAQPQFEPEHALALVIAASIHDLGHQGVNNSFLVETRAQVARLYNNDAVMENVSACLGWELLDSPGLDFLEGLGCEQRTRLRKLIVRLVISTDMSRHDALMASAARAQPPTPAGERCVHYERVRMKVAIKAADLGHACEEWPVHRRWVVQLQEELFRQGDAERRIGIASHSMRDRRLSISKPAEGEAAEAVAMAPRDSYGELSQLHASQPGFFDAVCVPLMREAARLMGPELEPLVELAMENRERWVRTLGRSSGELGSGGGGAPALGVPAV